VAGKREGKSHSEDVGIDGMVTLNNLGAVWCGLDLSASQYWRWRALVKPAIDMILSTVSIRDGKLVV
jgi:hypothetical protein